MGDRLQLDREPDLNRYVGRLDGAVVTTIAYRTAGSTMIITSTFTEPAHRGSGYAGVLTRFALDDARERGLRVVPRCPYTAEWIADHPGYGDLVE